MRGVDADQQELFSYKSIEDRIPKDHPIRPLRNIVDGILAELSNDFEELYSKYGRQSIAPERLLRALLIQVLFTIRSERQLMVQIDYNLLYRWFIGLGMDDKVWDPTTFTKNRDRLLEGEIARKFFDRVLALAKKHDLISKEHFTVDGTLIEAWASHKSFKPIEDNEQNRGNRSGGGRNPDVDFKGQKRKNDTHRSITDPDARLFRKSNSEGAQLCYMGNIVTENRNGLVVDVEVTLAEGMGERTAGKKMAANLPGGVRRVTMGADKGYDHEDFVRELRRLNVTPHIAQNESGYHTSYVDGRTVRHQGYKASQVKRKLVEQAFGWGKTVGLLRKVKHRGKPLVSWFTTFSMAAYNLIRVRNLVYSTA